MTTLAAARAVAEQAMNSAWSRAGMEAKHKEAFMRHWLLNYISSEMVKEPAFHALMKQLAEM